MSPAEVITALLIGVGGFFFLAGTTGLLRFPDLLTRVHALTKADNLGLGFIILGLLIQSDSIGVALKLVLIWGVALAAAATTSYLIASHALADDPPGVSDDA